MREFPVAEDVVLLSDVGLQSVGEGSPRDRFPLTADEEVVSLQERPVLARELFSQ